MNLGNATGHPSRIMDGSFANQVLAQMFLYERKFADLSDAEKAGAITVEVLPKHLDEEVAKVKYVFSQFDWQEFKKSFT